MSCPVALGTGDMAAACVTVLLDRMTVFAGCKKAVEGTVAMVLSWCVVDGGVQVLSGGQWLRPLAVTTDMGLEPVEAMMLQLEIMVMRRCTTCGNRA